MPIALSIVERCAQSPRCNVLASGMFLVSRFWFLVEILKFGLPITRNFKQETRNNTCALPLDLFEQLQRFSIT
jgi:hypothetical protein